jgi:hypothetical protein
LAPTIVQAIINGRQPVDLSLAVLVRPIPSNWTDQVKMLVSAGVPSKVSRQAARLRASA